MKKCIVLMMIALVTFTISACGVEEEGMTGIDENMSQEEGEAGDEKEETQPEESNEASGRRVPSKDDHVEEEEIVLEDWEAPDLTGKRILFFIAEGFHDTETTSPKEFLERLGAKTLLIGPEKEEVGAYNSRVTLQVEESFCNVDINDYDALVIPGGRSPMMLTSNEAAVDFVKEFMNTRKPVASICQGPRLLIAAGGLEGIRLTSAVFMENDLEAAGALFENEPVVTDRNIVTSREPGDLPLFNRAIADTLRDE